MGCLQFKVHRKMNVFNECVLFNSFMHNSDQLPLSASEYLCHNIEMDAEKAL